MSISTRGTQLIILVAAAALTIAIVGCGGDGGEAPETPGPGGGATATVTAEAEATPEATPTPPTSPEPEETPGEAPSARFDPEIYTCVDTPPFQATEDFDPTAYIWQVSAPRQPTSTVRPGDVVELGLRIKLGTPSDVFDFTAQVIDPAGDVSRSNGTVQSDSWTYLDYPADFGASPTVPGTYTVIYEVNDTFVACDGFVVEGQ